MYISLRASVATKQIQLVVTTANELKALEGTFSDEAKLFIRAWHKTAQTVSI